MKPIDYLGKQVSVIIDRPIGSRHPSHGFVYSLNYGYVPGTRSPDGEELDAYVLGISEPISNFEGTCIAAIHRLDDEDDKLVVVKPGERFSDEEIIELTAFVEKAFKIKILRVNDL